MNFHYFLMKAEHIFMFTTNQQLSCNKTIYKYVFSLLRDEKMPLEAADRYVGRVEKKFQI